MMSEKDFLEYIEAICKRPKLYTPTGSFYEIVSFLEGYGAGANVGENNYHFFSTPFRIWLAEKFELQETPINWKDFCNWFDSEKDALANLPILYKEYTELAD